jgi:multidrug efflux pump subunit AcrA (membrane-fusion protein)
LALTLAGTALIEANKVTTTSQTRAPCRSRPPIVQHRASPREANYLGVVRAGSDSDVGFEVAGVLTSMIATEGMRVAPGEVLAQLGIDRRQAGLDAANAPFERVVAERALADARERRGWSNDGSVSQQDYDDARFAAQALAAAESTAVAAERQSANWSWKKARCVAPYEAVVAERLVQTGAVVAPGTPVLRLVTATAERHILASRLMWRGDWHPENYLRSGASGRAYGDRRLGPFGMTWTQPHSPSALCLIYPQTHPSVSANPRCCRLPKSVICGWLAAITALLEALHGVSGTC